jgi:dTDP-4-amino-4,6-dideoxygalactose transaminase
VTTSTSTERLYLSPPHMGREELELIRQAFESNWIAPLGPHVDSFEEEFCAAVDAQHAVALSSGTAALHLALRLVGVGPGDEVVVSTFTFVASVSPIRYLGATPIFVDSEAETWNMDPALLAEVLARRARRGRLPKAVVIVHLYGQSADLDPIVELCDRYGVALVEDAAESLGADYRGRSPGTFGRAGIFSFNGNKIITTSGGGMLVSADKALVVRARKLATQARDAAPHYQHSEIGYNYRLSNVLAAIGRGQLRVLRERVEARRRNFTSYVDALSELSGIEFMPEASWGRHTRWMTCITIDSLQLGTDRESIRLALERENIEARPLWKPMHHQPVFEGCEYIGTGISDDLFARGLCLPSGSSLTLDDVERIRDVIYTVVRG